MPRNYFRTTLIFLIFSELLSIFAWLLPEFNLAVFLFILAITLILSLKKLEYGILIAWSELIIGSYGYLFSLEYGSTLISVRLGIFMVVMFAWLCHIVKNGGLKSYWLELKTFKFFKYYVALAIILVWGFVWGIVRANDFGNVFLDFNNWLFFLYLLPLITVSKKEIFWPNLKQVALAALTWLIIKTILLLYIFSHQFIWALPEVYQWIRDIRIGEITMMGNNFYRIFLQSQIFALLAFFILLPLNKNKSLIILSLTTVIISFSRSFWLGLTVGFCIYGLYLLLYQRKQILKQISKIVVIAVLSLAIIFVIIILPPKISGDSLGSLISKRATEIEAAGSSRINMLKPLAESIIKHPVIGSGFGATVTYKSVDQRLLATTAGASGEYTTYAFEWAYLDLLLKIGLVGVFVYLLLIFKILQILWQNILNKNDYPPTGDPPSPVRKIPNRKLGDELRIIPLRGIPLHQSGKFQTENWGTDYGLRLGIFLALISLLAVNIFTPYLNHPLGIGFILISSIYAQSFNRHRHL
ncbi:hypothetical protein A3B87_02100 [Candidatus Kuenenbacteria bacterium RIFCSPHIGHO2_02_FULL_39_13]|uniref:O-antigen ligase-related domain-containing protein n=1 Tax=Candidatus Kuenenbacteria bacterium RIFCSPHIGHO2_02_FULL_39_13 TaxID=1798561 RepID=A0A1F6FNM8_9BACT|nr:MAG: hypothetical protein A3B87_02100 [Candidatus Kuenenbacteria bacterium RIFCSPHIGHO2_02_FULL_39_13]